MEIEFIPSVKDLSLEARQVRTIRIGFQLLGAYLGLQLALLMVQVFSLPDEGLAETSKPIDRRAQVIGIVVTFLPALFTLVPGAVLHFRAGRTSRWRIAAVGLVATILLEMVAAGVWVATIDPMTRPEGGQPLVARASVLLLQLLGAVEYWWLAVLVAEFAAACRATPILLETEYLGYVVMGCVLAVLALATWTLPDPMALQDEFSMTLQLGIVAASIILTVWTFRLVLSSSALSRIVTERLEAVQEQLSSKVEKQD